VNTAEIISKVTMTLSLINSKNDFDFVGWVIKTPSVAPCLFYFRSVKFHYVRGIHMMLVAFWRWWKLLQHLSEKDNERNLCQDLLTIENTDSDLQTLLFSCLKFVSRWKRCVVKILEDFTEENLRKSQIKPNTVKNTFVWAFITQDESPKF